MAKIVHMSDGPFATAICVAGQPDQTIRLAATVAGLTRTVTMTKAEARALASAIHSECTALELAKAEAAEARGL
jgi:hypothetical protein